MVDAAKHLDYTSGLLLPGINVKTDGESDPYPIEAMQVATDVSGGQSHGHGGFGPGNR